MVSWRQRLQLQRVEVQGPFPSDLDPTSFVTGNALAELQREPPAPDPRLRGMVLTGVLDEVDALLKQGRSSAHDIAEMLAQYLRFYPEKAGELLAVLKAGMYPDAVQAAAFLALERTGTPQSQAALMEALRDRQMGSMNRMRAAVALPDVPMPSQESVEGLIGVSRTGRSTGDKDEEMVAGTALRALGTVSRNVKNTQPGLARLALSEVRAELSAATETHQLTSALDAAGNSGDESLALELERFHRHDSSQVRSRAALAYRRMDARSSGPALSAWLRQEPDGTVRQSILEALLQISQAAGGSAAPRDAVTTAAAQLASETNPRTRELLIQLLGTAVQSAPEARAALVAHFHREREPRLLILIGRYVSVEELD